MKKYLALSLLIGATTLLQADPYYQGQGQGQGSCYQDQQYGGNYGSGMPNDPRNMQRQSSFANEDDRRAYNELSDMVNQGRYNGVSFSVENGMVNLWGQVSTQNDRMDLEKSVRNMRGVRSVNNQVMVTNNQNMPGNGNRNGNMPNNKMSNY